MIKNWKTSGLGVAFSVVGLVSAYDWSNGFSWRTFLPYLGVGVVGLFAKDAGQQGGGF